jgi:hypothetical protein
VPETVVSQGIQDSFVLLSIQDTKFLQAARPVVKITYFASEITANLVQLCYNFFDQFKVAPGANFKDEVLHFLQSKDPEKQKLYLAYFDKVQAIEKPNVPYVIASINKFVQSRELEKGTIQVVQLAKEGKFLEARSVMQTMLRAGIHSEEVGLKYFEAGLPTYLQPHRSNEKLMGTGLGAIDSKFSRGLCRTDFVCILGGYKGKKSWGCTHLGCVALKAGLRVVHITHELSLEDTEKRYDMMLGGFAQSTEYLTQQVTIENVNDAGETQSTDVFDIPTVADMIKVQTVRHTVRRFGGQLIIRKYPMGTCTMDEIDRYLDYLETFEGFIPDVVINDYVEKMKLPVQNRCDFINEMYIRSKGIADERKLLMITVSQVKREALRKHKLDQKDFAEDIRKLGNTDLVYAISQTEQEAQKGRMLWWVMASRHGAMDYGALFSQNLDIGQFHIKDWSYTTVQSRPDTPTGDR